MLTQFFSEAPYPVCLHGCPAQKECLYQGLLLAIFHLLDPPPSALCNRSLWSCPTLKPWTDMYRLPCPLLSPGACSNSAATIVGDTIKQSNHLIPPCLDGCQPTYPCIELSFSLTAPVPTLPAPHSEYAES